MSFIKSFAWILGGILTLSPGLAMAEKPAVLTLEAGSQETYTHPQAIKRVAVGNPAVAGITVLSTHDLLITGKQAGVTEVSLWESEKASKPARVIRVEVNVSASMERQRLEAADAGSLQASASGNGMILSGWATSLEKHALAQQALALDPKQPLDASTAAFDSQVQIDIKVVEVSRQSMKRAGLFLSKNQPNTTIAIGSPGTLSSVVSSGNGFTLNSSSGFLPINNAFNLILGNATSGLLGTLSVLEANGFAYTLAEPSLTAISGQSATFLAGGEFPVPIRTGGGADSTITIRYKEYGVRLMLTPTVLDANRIYLKVSPEVSELDFANSVQTGGVSVPGLRVRRTDTSVSLGDGESFVISGLVSRNTLSNVDKFPWLGDLPVIGAFFRSTRFDREDKELLMVVTPHLVRPIARDAKLPALPGGEIHNYNPSFSELFFQTGGSPALPFTGMSK
ncbi:MAG TPA: type II and III secretion system protein family protein [Methylophilaceae bacterium]|nr:type II and III secretion system protein family protein [Methylophilaceae bacterium]